MTFICSLLTEKQKKMNILFQQPFRFIKNLFPTQKDGREEKGMSAALFPHLFVAQISPPGTDVASFSL